MQAVSATAINLSFTSKSRLLFEVGALDVVALIGALVTRRVA